MLCLFSSFSTHARHMDFCSALLGACYGGFIAPSSAHKHHLAPVHGALPVMDASKSWKKQ